MENDCNVDNIDNEALIFFIKFVDSETCLNKAVLFTFPKHTQIHKILQNCQFILT